MLARLSGFTLGNRGGLVPKINTCMFTAQGPSVLHAIKVAVVQYAQVRLVIYIGLEVIINNTMQCMPPIN